MAKVSTLRAFYDMSAQIMRRQGDVFAVDDERAREIESKIPKYVSVTYEDVDGQHEDYSKYTRPQLIEMIEERGLSLPKRQNKADLIAVLEG